MLINPVKKKTILSGRGITQRGLAKVTGFSEDQIKHVLNLKRSTPHVQEAIARQFGQTVDSIFGRWAWPRQRKKKGPGPRVKREGTGKMLINPVKRKTVLSGRGITHTRLAKELGYSRDQLKHVLNLRRTTPHIQEAVAQYFGKSVEEIFGRWAWTKRKSLRVQRFKGSRV